MRPTNFQGNIHIINFPPETTAAELAELFDDYGLVLGAHIKRIPQESGSLRLGIVAIAPNEAADKAIEALQGHTIRGQKLKLKRAVPPVKGERKPGPRRTERPIIDRPPMDRQIGDRQIGDRQIGDRQIGDRQIGDRQIGDRQFGDRQMGDRQFGDRPMMERSTLSASRERFPAMASQEPPRKVIVEYRNRRGTRTITG
jgi:RNA recognition motif-containing protein